MFPKEHGAYGQLLFPILTALAVGRPTAAAMLLASAAVLTFLAHEPLLVLLGQRGPRAARADRSRAIGWFVATGGAAVVFGVASMLIAPSSVRAAVAVPGALTVVLAAVIVSGREHSAVGELVAAATFASLAYPVARAGGAASHASLTCALAFAAMFIASTVCVRAVIQHTRRPPAWPARVGGVAVAFGALCVLWSMAEAGRLSSIAAVGALPACLAAALVALFAPGSRRLRLIGWTLVTTTMLGAVALIAALG